jgi:hypothetical protein
MFFSLFRRKKMLVIFKPDFTYISWNFHRLRVLVNVNHLVFRYVSITGYICIMSNLCRYIGKRPIVSSKYLGGIIYSFRAVSKWNSSLKKITLWLCSKFELSRVIQLLKDFFTLLLYSVIVGLAPEFFIASKFAKFAWQSCSTTWQTISLRFSLPGFWLRTYL